MKKLLLLLAILPFMISCNGQGKKITIDENTANAKKKLKTDTVEFISYWDKNDENNFVVKKGENSFSFVLKDFIDHNFKKGDLLEIKWDDTDTIQHYLPVLVSAHRTKEGPLSNFLKAHELELQYTWKYQCSGGFITKSYSIVQYYLSITQNKKVKQALIDLSKNDKTQNVKIGKKIIDYVIERQAVINNKKLIVINIRLFTYGGGITKIQDIYYENETDRIYELDQNYQKLTEIK